MYYTLTEKIIGGLFAMILAAAIAFCFGAFFDIAQSVRAERASIACKQQRMVPERLSFSANVTCVPAMTRNDSLTVLGR